MVKKKSMKGNSEKSCNDSKNFMYGLLAIVAIVAIVSLVVMVNVVKVSGSRGKMVAVKRGGPLAGHAIDFCFVDSQEQPVFNSDYVDSGVGYLDSNQLVVSGDNSTNQS